MVAVDGNPVFDRGCKSMNDFGEGDASVLSVQRNDDLHEIRILLDVLVP